MTQETIFQRRKKVVLMKKEEILLLLRAYQAHPTRWIDILDEIKDNIQGLNQEAKDLYQNSSNKQLRDRLSAKFGKLMVLDTNGIKYLEIRNEIAKMKRAETRLLERTDPPIQDRRAATINNISDDSDDQDQPQQPGQQQQRPQQLQGPPLPAAVNLQPQQPGQQQKRPQQPQEPPRPAAVNVQPQQPGQQQQRPQQPQGPPRPAAVKVQHNRDLHNSKINNQVLPTNAVRKKRPLAALIRENQLAYNKFITKKVPKI